MTRFVRSIFVLLFTLSTVYSAYAQLDADVAISPKNPEPYQEVTLTLSSYTFDINIATIIWKSGKTTLLSGFGSKTLKVKMGDAGQSSTITYLATASDGTVVTGSITLTPQFVNLIYESRESYVPPFYEGRSLPAEGANVRVTALASIGDSGKKVPTSNLSFSWYVNDEFYTSGSGIGGSVATIPLDYLTNATDIRVIVRSPQGNVAEKTISIYPHAVTPLLYSFDEILGPDYAHAFSTRMELTKDITLLLEPFYLSSRNGLDRTATISWYLDGLPITPQEKTILSLKPKANSSGSRMLTIIVENSKRLLQKAQSDIEVIFDTRN